MKTIVRVAMAASLLASPAVAQSPASDSSPAPDPSPPVSWNGLPDRFRIDAGYFGLSAKTVLNLNGGDVDFEKDLDVNPNASTFWVDGTWRVGRRHQVELSFTHVSRQGSHTLTRDFTWGGEIYSAGLTASSSTSTDITGGYYRFAAYRSDRFEIGPTVGIGYLSLNAEIRATGTGSQGRTLDKSGGSGSITGAVGGYAQGWLTRRLVTRADFLYIKVSSGSKVQSVTDSRIGADYYVFRNVGLGVQYKYNKYRASLASQSTELGGELIFKGFQVYLSFLFR